MRFRDPTYSATELESRTQPRLLIWLHWATVFAVLVSVGLVLIRAAVETSALRREILQWHRYIGISVFGLTVLRLAIHLTTLKQASTLAQIARLPAFIQGLLYSGLLVLPVLGYLQTTSRLGKIDYFGYALPVFIQRQPDLAENLSTLHSYGAWIFLGLSALHSLAALWHHYVLGDDVLRNMRLNQRI